ncbi:MAG: ankyrin repeat domain-containing protein, partial [Gemmatimonadetes bacterium]|nr:ankyrin repeat domain-containing protein [Gemmatimonadota bacterium]NIT66859.1 ankyrin repeat domain-containing protein [Gemmatimonadota bacterium]NIY35436.1 ankyrin repeat domain-containing protein [Gemmatimonadota bacterium]
MHRRGRKRNDQALCDAASIGDLSAVKRLLAARADENSADEDGTTALMAAAFAGQAAVVRLLLDHGADADLQDEAGLTALMNAVIA